MLGFSPKLPITEEQRVWVNNGFRCLERILGRNRMLEARVIEPTAEDFPDPYSKDAEAAERLFARVCHYMQVDPDSVGFELFPDETEELSTMVPSWRDDGGTRAAGVYLHGHEQDRATVTGRKIVAIRSTMLKDPLSLVATVAHELGHVILLGGNLLDSRDPDHEPLTDLLTVFVGMGIFTANSAAQFRQFQEDQQIGWSTQHLGYLPERVFGYAGKVRCRTCRKKAKLVAAFISERPFRFQKFKALARTESTVRSPGETNRITCQGQNVARFLLQCSVLILISAGEASGEMYGAQLIEALRRAASKNPAELRSARTGEAPVSTHSPVPTQSGQLQFFGVGGDRMRAAGCDTVVDARDLAVVGITEIVSHLPKILGLYRHLIEEADRRKADLAIVIDSPAFNWRVARQMKKRGIPTVYYVAPQFWAWRQGRVRLIRDYIDKALVIFPFEEKFYRDRGVDATFVGHPLAELPTPTITRDDYAKQFNLDPTKPWITLMPGSRIKEVRMNLPTILESAAQLGGAYEYLLPVAPTLDRSFLSRLMGAQKITLVPEALPALYHSRAAIVASGTATVEAAMMNTPFVMVYRVSPLTYLLGKPRVKVLRFAMVNLIAEEEVVPELVQKDFTAENVVARLREILPDGPARNHMLEGLARVKALLRGPQPDHAAEHPADRAAKIILALGNRLASKR